MNILIIAYYYPPILSGGSSRPLNMAKFLTRFGYNVTVLTHSYQEDDLKNPQVLRIYDRSHNKNRDGFHLLKWLILRLYVEFLNRIGFYKSIYDFWKNRVINSADRIINLTKPDFIIATYPPVETLELGLYFKEKYNIPLLTDFRDGLVFESIEEKRILKYSCVKKRYELIEQRAACKSTVVTAVSPLISEYFLKKYGCGNVSTITNGYDPEDFTDLSRPPALDKNKINIVYTGRFSLAESQRDVDHFFDGIRKLISDYPRLTNSFVFHLIGQFTNKEKRDVKDLTKKGLIRFHKLMEKRTAISYQKYADLLLLFTSLKRRYMAPGKLFEYLYSRTPILALTSDTFAGDIVKKTGTGWIIHPQDEKKIYDFMFDFITKPGFSKTRVPQMDLIQTYSINRLMKKLAEILKLHKP